MSYTFPTPAQQYTGNQPQTAPSNGLEAVLQQRAMMASLTSRMPQAQTMSFTDAQNQFTQQQSPAAQAQQAFQTLVQQNPTFVSPSTPLANTMAFLQGQQSFQQQPFFVTQQQPQSAPSTTTSQLQNAQNPPQTQPQTPQSSTNTSTQLQMSNGNSTNPEEDAQQGSNRFFTVTQIKQVQELIEGCLKRYMSQADTINQLCGTYSEIQPGFISLMWQKLEQQNPDFFRAYYVRLRLKEHIMQFNELVNIQAAMMQQQGVIVHANFAPQPQPQAIQLQQPALTFAQFPTAQGAQPMYTVIGGQPAFLQPAQQQAQGNPLQPTQQAPATQQPAFFVPFDPTNPYNSQSPTQMAALRSLTTVTLQPPNGQFQPRFVHGPAMGTTPLTPQQQQMYAMTTGQPMTPQQTQQPATPQQQPTQPAPAPAPAQQQPPPRKSSRVRSKKNQPPSSPPEPEQQPQQPQQHPPQQVAQTYQQMSYDQAMHQQHMDDMHALNLQAALAQNQAQSQQLQHMIHQRLMKKDDYQQQQQQPTHQQYMYQMQQNNNLSQPHPQEEHQQQHSQDIQQSEHSMLPSSVLNLDKHFYEDNDIDAFFINDGN